MDKTFQAINNIAESLSKSSDYSSVGRQIGNLTQTIRHSFINDYDKGVVDAMFEVNYSLNKIADLIASNNPELISLLSNDDNNSVSTITFLG